jgi:hypothetical protein
MWYVFGRTELAESHESEGVRLKGVAERFLARARTADPSPPRWRYVALTYSLSRTTFDCSWNYVLMRV